MLLVPATSIVNAQEYGDRYEKENDVYYEDDRYYQEKGKDRYYNDDYGYGYDNSDRYYNDDYRQTSHDKEYKKIDEKENDKPVILMENNNPVSTQQKVQKEKKTTNAVSKERCIVL